jgi:asparagine synthase (glutamine-hydrolysing)
MCGIAGFIGTDERLSEDVLQRMQRAQSHRGPDDTGIYFRQLVGEDGRAVRCGAAHNRLSILDLSQAGHQPMISADDRHVLCYNGEFYNYRHYQGKLRHQGVPLTSNSDTEVLLHLCRLEGVEKAVAEINGMFAFSFFDADEVRLTLCRDRAGQKPLYYSLLDDGSLLYASELPALLASGLIPEELDLAAFDAYWTVGYTYATQTIYRHVKRLPPGYIGVWHRDAFRPHSYWQVNFDPVDTGASLDDHIDALLDLLRDAVRLRLVSDVPVGICLSGGLDSILVATVMSQLKAEVPAYTIAFDDARHNEADAAAAVAATLGLEHHVLRVNQHQSSLFADIAGWYGEPFGDASSVPMYFLAQLIRQHATVALTGDGGDELFGGYQHYQQALSIWGTAPQSAGSDRGARTALRRQVLRWMGFERGYLRMQSHLNRRLKRRLYTQQAWQVTARQQGPMDRREWLNGSQDLLARMQNLDFHVYMTDDVLAKVDRMSMAHGLECRSPFMDYRIIEWAAKLPAHVKIDQQGRGKLILRETLARFLPASHYDRPKQGFTPPWEAWFRGALQEQVRRDWRMSGLPHVRPTLDQALVPEQGTPSPVLSWLVFSYLQWDKQRPLV